MPLFPNRERNLPAEQEYINKRSPEPQDDDEDDDTEGAFSLTRPITITVVVPVAPTTLARTAITSLSRASPLPTSNLPVLPISYSYSTTRITTWTVEENGPSSTPSVSVNNNGTAQTTSTGGNLTPQSGALRSSSTLPAGAIIGVTLAVLFLIISSGVFIVRRRLIRNRKKRRETWIRPMKEQDNAFLADEKGGQSQTVAMTDNRGDETPNTLAQFPEPPQLNAPSTSYNNNPIGPQTPVLGSASFAATVVSTFIPSLPDELSISTGEIVRVLAEYDDGWALCSNMNDEKGMVPLECLARGGSAIGRLQAQEASNKRASSLGVNDAAGRRA